MKFLSRIYAISQTNHLNAAEKLALKQAADDLHATRTFVTAARKPHRQTGSKNLRDGRDKLARPRKIPELKGVIIDGIRCCRLCKRPLPHRTKPERSYHMLAAKRRWMQQAAKRYWTRVGYDKMWKRSVAARYKRAIERRTAIFKQIAPLAAAKLGDREIERLINTRRPGKTRYLEPIAKYEAWVRKRFGR